MRRAKSLFLYGAIFFLVSCRIDTVKPPLGETNLPSTPNFTDREQLPAIRATTPPLPSTIPSIVPTSTPLPPIREPVALPTISPEAAKSFVLELTNDNQNCMLPCFWNITPGKTAWQNAEPFLSTFASLISYGASDGTFSETPAGDSFIAWMYLFFPELSNAPFSYAFGVRDGIVTMVDASVLPVPNNRLPSILNAYGQPSEIWLLTANAPMDDILGFSLTLFYAQHHFMLVYSNWGGEIIDGKVHGCISGEDSLHLVAWSADEELTFAETIEGLHALRRPTIYDLPLEESTGMRVETFYETFKTDNKPICIETPMELWPGP